MRLEIVCQDRVGIAQSVLAIFVERDIDVRAIEIRKPGVIFIHLPELDFSEIQKFMPQVRLIDGVNDIKTTPYMPWEREKNEFETLVHAFPDPFVSINIKGQVRIVNNSAAQIMGDSPSTIVGEYINHWLKGFNLLRWFDSDIVVSQTQRVSINDADFVADIIPIFVDEDDERQILAGAMLIFKSEARLGEQISALKFIKEDTFTGIQASSSAMKKLIREAKRMAILDSSMLIVGETGTGKELLARACHQASHRADKPFMTLNCATIPDEVAETELFGYGSADSENFKKGIFEAADGGTLFFDEVGEMSETLQTKVLRVIQDGTFRRINDEKEITVNVRFISATNKDLLNLVSMGEFREDLYYRLNVLGLNIPSLRNRQADIVALAEGFISKYSRDSGKYNISLDEQCMAFIQSYPWPGNVRQLENVIIRALSLIEDNIIRVKHLQLPTYTAEHGYLEQEFTGTLDSAIKEFEAELLRKLYPAYPSTRQLAKKLGLSHTAIANKLREYDINKRTIKM